MIRPTLRRAFESDICNPITQCFTMCIKRSITNYVTILDFADIQRIFANSAFFRNMC